MLTSCPATELHPGLSQGLLTSVDSYSYALQT